MRPAPAPQRRSNDVLPLPCMPRGNPRRDRRAGVARSMLVLGVLTLTACEGSDIVGNLHGATNTLPDASAQDVVPSGFDAQGAEQDAGPSAIDAQGAEQDAGPSAIDAPDAAPDAVPVDAHRPCTGTSDCADQPGRSVCDTTTGTCVGCVPAPDTCPSGHYCVAAMGVCAVGCHADDGCPATPVDAGVTDGGDAGTVAGRCDPVTHACVQCLADADCPPGTLCMAHGCVVGCNTAHGCPSGQACCDGGCVDPASNVMACGGCGRSCTASHATPACLAGACTVGTCTAPYADCNRDPADGCETDLSASAAHCGGCGTACPGGAHATATCAAGLCGLACAMGYGDCNGDPRDGCEADLSVTSAHCGACATGCTSVQACSAGACVACGGVGQPCCASGACSGGVCASGTCTACGGGGQPCCPGASCGAGQVCRGGSCLGCGSLGGPCCADGGCDIGACHYDTGLCGGCGMLGQPCCHGTCYDSGSACSGSLCVACGALGGPCCCGGTGRPYPDDCYCHGGTCGRSSDMRCH